MPHTRSGTDKQTYSLWGGWEGGVVIIAGASLHYGWLRPVCTLKHNNSNFTEYSMIRYNPTTATPTTWCNKWCGRTQCVIGRFWIGIHVTYITYIILLFLVVLHKLCHSQTEAKKSEGIQECFKEEWNVVSRGRNTPFLLQSIHTHARTTGLLFLGP